MSFYIRSYPDGEWLQIEDRVQISPDGENLILTSIKEVSSVLRNHFENREYLGCSSDNPYWDISPFVKKSH